MLSIALQSRKSPMQIFGTLLTALGLYLTLNVAYAETPNADVEENVVPAQSKEGSLLVVLRNISTKQNLDTQQLLHEGIPESYKQKQLENRKNLFAKNDKELGNLLKGTPGLEKLHVYPALLSYVIDVKDVEAANLYLQKIAKNQNSILSVGRFYPATAELDVSSKALMIRSDENPIGDNWWSGEIRFAPVNIGILDDGANINHPMLANPARKFYCQPVGESNPSCAEDLLSAHGTSMTGIYASTLEKFSGITTMPGSTHLRKPGPAYNFLIAKAGPETVDGREGSLEGLNWLIDASDRPFPDIINYSQGNGMICPDENTDCDPTAYSAFSTVIDDVIDTQGIVFLKSAGNKSYNSQKVTVTVPGDAYNVIAVGNLNPFDWKSCLRGGDREEFKIYATSSVSPPYAQLDNNQARRLLHVAAPGRYINTTGLNPAFCKDRCEGNPDVPTCLTTCDLLGKPIEGTDVEKVGYWRQSTGTSPSAPMVGSVAALLHSSGIRHPAAIKAIIINAADSWTSDNKPHPVAPDVDPINVNCSDTNAPFHKPVSGTHYDRSYGFGVLNAGTAYKQRDNVILDIISSREVKEYTGPLAAFEKATLVWQKHNGSDLTRLGFKLSYQVGEEGKWIELMSDDGLLDNVKQVSNGTMRITPPAGATKFKLTVRPLGKVPTPDEAQVFALVTAQPFAPAAN